MKVGIIGGSGLDKASFFRNSCEVTASTVWGQPSGPVLEGEIDGVQVVQISRHGREHTLTPSGVNYRANIQFLKDAGCSCVLATTAVGSLRHEIGRGDLVVLDQFIDFTKTRAMTFFDEFAPHNARHTSMAEPFDSTLRAIFIEEAARLGVRFHKSGTVITIEGPRFSTRAESHMYRMWGADVVNMSVATEAALANEIGLPYAAVAMSTDYDSWNEEDEPVSWEQILEVFAANVEHVMRLLLATIPRASEAFAGKNR